MTYCLRFLEQVLAACDRNIHNFLTLQLKNNVGNYKHVLKRKIYEEFPALKTFGNCTSLMVNIREAKQARVGTEMPEIYIVVT